MSSNYGSPAYGDRGQQIPAQWVAEEDGGCGVVGEKEWEGLLRLLTLLIEHREGKCAELPVQDQHAMPHKAGRRLYISHCYIFTWLGSSPCLLPTQTEIRTIDVSLRNCAAPALGHEGRDSPDGGIRDIERLCYLYFG